MTGKKNPKRGLTILNGRGNKDLPCCPCRFLYESWHSSGTLSACPSTVVLVIYGCHHDKEVARPIALTWFPVCVRPFRRQAFGMHSHVYRHSEGLHRFLFVAIVMAYEDNISTSLDGHDTHVRKGIVVCHGSHFHVIRKTRPVYPNSWRRRSVITAGDTHAGRAAS